MASEKIYLDTYVLQQDMRIRMPKAILSNLNAEKGITKFDIFLDTEEKTLVLKIHDNTDGGNNG
ncbi:MAG: sucrose-6-phosphate hydrolase [Clostridia bacterium]|jgi:hypothetical protein|nr:sucrose-6-phosphate hydrolase [Clostridia bacterium]